MDNINNNLGNKEEEHTLPASENEVVEDNKEQLPGNYPQPPEWTKNIVVSDKPWPVPEEFGNLTVVLNESEKEENPADVKHTVSGSSYRKEWPLGLQLGMIILIALVAAILMKNALYVRNQPDEGTEPVQHTVVSEPVINEYTPTVIPSTTMADIKGTTVGKEEKTTAARQEKTTAGVSNSDALSSDGIEKSDEEAKRKTVEFFNESSNRVKTEAVKVVKNFEKRTHNADKLVLPSAIKGVGQSILESKIESVNEPVEYPTQEAIIARYPVPGAELSSTLDADDVEKAVCTEKGNEYEITLYLKKCVDPEPGKGTSKAMDCLDVPTVRDTAPEFITGFSAEYYDCIIRCRVDKATGRVVWSNYTTPVLIKVGFDAGFVAFDAEIGLTFEKDYTVIY